MSLNGLDAHAVVEAHQSALADPGGWFLLQYANRDTVEVLDRGNGGVAEAKGAVERYEQKSPLYGMVQYRRKRVLLKYVPEGTSRLLQVRLAVQFQSILDAFPHDTIFSFTAAPELVESALGLCTMLQPTNGGSLKSSDSSVKQRRLNEISEDAEDLNTSVRKEEGTFTQLGQEAHVHEPDTSEMNTLPASALRAKALLAKRKEENEAASQAGTAFSPISAPQPAPAPPPPPPATTLFTEPPLVIVPEPPRPSSSLSQQKTRDETQPLVSPLSVAPDNNPELDSEEPRSKQFHHSRHLSENESKNISHWNEQVEAYNPPAILSNPKPKKKLAPRPHVEVQTRPKTASQYDDFVPARQVANLPQSVRVLNRPNTATFTRPGSQQSTRSVPARFRSTPSLPPPLPEFNFSQSPLMRPESRQAGSVPSSAMADPPAASPEKMRLMKALQKRKRNQLLAQRAASAQSSFATDRDDFPLDMPERPTTAVPATILEETAPTSQETKSVQDSSTASPTSVATKSESLSTRPSSLADDKGSQRSQKSTSNDTDSSSTPKAVAENARRAAGKKHTSWYDSAPDLDEANTQSYMTPQLSPLDESFSTHRYSRTPQLSPLEDTFPPIRENTTPTLQQLKNEPTASPRQDRSTFSWLASDSQLNLVQNFLQSADTEPTSENQAPNALSIDTLIRPITESSSVASDDDDAFAEELHSATVHEATPVSVSRPPLTPTMTTLSIERPRAATTSTSSFTIKSNSSTPNAYDKSPGPSLRESSTALPQWPPSRSGEPTAIQLTKRAALSSGISKRIKALEDSSRRDVSGSSTPSAHESSMTRSTFSTLMKRTSFISQFQGANASTDKISTKEVVLNPSPAARPKVYRLDSSPELHQQQQAHIEAAPVLNVTQYGQPQSNMHDNQHPTYNSHSSGFPHASLLPDMHGAPIEPPSSPSSDKKRFSFASYRSGSSNRWMYSESMASRLSVATKDNRNSTATPSEASSIVNEGKRGSRTSRLMKRISGFGNRSSGKGQTAPPTREGFRPDPIMEQNETHTRSESLSEPSAMQTIDIGDVNVQFPEALLWKRRFLRIDDQGYLIFSAPTENPTIRSTSRKFHLGDIQEPCLPDVEREEMAYSVLLDLRDGNSIQCACESKQGQARVLKYLLDAHTAYHSLYPDSLE